MVQSNGYDNIVKDLSNAYEIIGITALYLPFYFGIIFAIMVLDALTHID